MKNAFITMILTAFCLTAVEPAVAQHDDNPADVVGLTDSVQGVDFNEAKTLDEILSIAKKEGKPAFVVFTTTTSEYCKKMDNKEFPKKEAGDYFNKNYVNWKVDIEKGDGKELMKRYDVYAYPTFLILDSEGNLIGRGMGAADITDFIKKVEKVQSEDKGVAWYWREFKSGNRDPKFINEYKDIAVYNYMAEAMNDADSVALAILNDKRTVEIASDKELFKMFQRQNYHVDDVQFLEMYKEKALVAEKIGEEAAKDLEKEWKDGALKCIILEERNYIGFDEEKFKAYQQKMKEHGVPNISDIVDGTLFANASYVNDYPTLLKYLKKDLKADGSILDDIQVLIVLRDLKDNFKDNKKNQNLVQAVAKQRIANLEKVDTSKESPYALKDDTEITLTEYLIGQFQEILK